LDSELTGNIESIETKTNDTINFKILFKKDNVSQLIFDSTSINFQYRFGRVSKIENLKNDRVIDQTRIIRIFPYVWIFNNGLNYILVKGFVNMNKIKFISGLTTFSKTKIRYNKGRVKKIKNYGWQTVAQDCHYFGYNTFNYVNDTTVIERAFDRNDSLAIEDTYTFDNNGNILNIKSQIRKRAIGWGIDATFYAYDGNSIKTRNFNYKFDKYGNWIEKVEYSDNILQNKTLRKINYKN
jgi:hypothetical protein